MLEHTFILKDGTKIPRVGIGTWHIGEDKQKEIDEYQALQLALEKGVKLIDTAEMYSDGQSETMVGKVISNFKREDLFIVSKILPQNAYKERFYESLNASLDRLNTSYLDLYLLHWRGNIPLQETVNCMEQAKQMGLIKNWGVSNFDVEDMEELYKVKYGLNCAINQCLYNLASRGVEFSLLDNLKSHNIGFMAYCPLVEGKDMTQKLINDEDIKSISNKYGISPYSLLLLFTLRKENVISIFKAGNKKHMLENLAGLNVNISSSDWNIIDKKLPAPKYKRYLDMR